MGMPQTARRYTVEEVLALPNDGNRYELVHGELLVTPAPQGRHQYVVGEIFAALHQYLLQHRGIARVVLSPADISWAEDVLVQPDVFVVPLEEISEEWSSIRTLLLAVEVLSPSTALRPGAQARGLPRARRSDLLDRGSGRDGGRGLAPGRPTPRDRDRGAPLARSPRRGRAGDRSR